MEEAVALLGWNAEKETKQVLQEENREKAETGKISATARAALLGFFPAQLLGDRIEITIRRR